MQDFVVCIFLCTYTGADYNILRMFIASWKIYKIRVSPDVCEKFPREIAIMNLN